MLPQAISALKESGEELVVRLDGPLEDGELLAAFRWLTDPDGRGRVAFSAARTGEHAPREVYCTVAIQPSPQVLASLCGDMALGLERSVRLRVVSVREDLVTPLVESAAAAGEADRWKEIVPQAGFVLGTTRGLRSLHIFTRRLDATAVKARVRRRLMSAAAGAPAASGAASAASSPA